MTQHPCVGPHFRTLRGRMICNCGCDQCYDPDTYCSCTGCQCRTPDDHDD